MEPEVLRFTRHDTGLVVARMSELAELHRGWINFVPEVDEERLTEVPQTGGLFSGSGPAVPLCTWTPGEVRRRGIEPPQIGLQHASGPKVANRLAALGHGVPEGWVRLQDHSRRGLVLAVPPEIPHAEVLGWLLLAGELVSVVRVTGYWQAAVFAGG